jgi:hypothetical protein
MRSYPDSDTATLTTRPDPASTILNNSRAAPARWRLPMAGLQTPSADPQTPSPDWETRWQSCKRRWWPCRRRWQAWKPRMPTGKRRLQVRKIPGNGPSSPRTPALAAFGPALHPEPETRRNPLQPVPRHRLSSSLRFSVFRLDGYRPGRISSPHGANKTPISGMFLRQYPNALRSCNVNSKLGREDEWHHFETKQKQNES